MSIFEDLILGKENEEEVDDTKDQNAHPLAYKSISTDTAKELGSGIKKVIEKG